jgi:predicted GNAT family acetyltransferase
VIDVQRGMVVGVDADHEIAVDYDPVGEASILIKHTEVLPDHEGKGFGARLVQSALDHVRGQGKTVIPIARSR